MPKYATILTGIVASICVCSCQSTNPVEETATSPIKARYTCEQPDDVDAVITACPTGSSPSAPAVVEVLMPVSVYKQRARHLYTQMKAKGYDWLGHVVFDVIINDGEVHRIVRVFNDPVEIGWFGTLDDEPLMEDVSRFLWRHEVPHGWLFSMGPYLWTPRTLAQQALRLLRSEPRFAKNVYDPRG